VRPFDELGDYVAIPAVTALRLAPDGSWLAAAVQTLGPDRTKFATSIWRIEAGRPADSSQADSSQADSSQAAPVRLTRSAAGESGHQFLPDGSLLFISARPDPASDQQGDEPAADKPALWLLPASGGEASRIAAPPGGVARVATARNAQAYVVAAPVFPAAAGARQDAERRTARKDAGVTAILHEAGLVRFWDHDLGPDCLRLLAAWHTGTAPGPGEPRDLTPDPGRALDEHSFELTPDGSAAVTGWSVPEAGGAVRSEVTVIDVATAERRTLLAAAGVDFESPRVSPDGLLVAAIRSEHNTYDRPGDVSLVVAALDGSDAGPRELLAGLDRRPLETAWAPDSGSVYFTADDQGRRPIFRADLHSGEITRVTADDGAYDNLCPAPDGHALFALRAAVNEPPTPVRIDLADPQQDPVRLPSPTGAIELPGRLEEVAATAADGVPVRAWLVLPEGASAQSPAPLLLWVHGGPVASWNSWSWRWNPWLLAARGYAVLLPDPALSTGYGQDFIARGYGRWGDKPFTDVLASTDAVMARPDIDAGRTAMMGGSFGGYMANWIAGHTDRFTAIVSHAGLWALDQMFGTTDSPAFWRHEFGDPAAQPGRYLANSPHLHAERIVTPMLIIHGDKDYRVPIGEALRLYSDLVGRGASAKFLYFPDENHWILKPGDVRVWYETVLAFLAQHVLGEQWRRPELL